MMSRNCLVPFRSVPFRSVPFRCAVCLMAALPAATALAAPDIDDIEDIGDMLEILVEDLSAQGDGCGGVSHIGEPTVVEDTSGVVFASSPILLSVDGTTEATGTAFLTVDPDLGTVDSVMVITRDSITYTLSLSVELDDDELHICGYISYFQSPSTLTYEGGWAYTVANGLETDEGTDEELEETLIDLFGCDPEDALALNLANSLQQLGNWLIMGVNYVVDFFKPYTPPTQCDGPQFFDGSGQSCENRTISCKDDLDELSELINNLTGVSLGFKKCMKGRAGCGGSSFERARVSCSTSNDCGPCGNAAGCSNYGTRIWYCEPENADTCRCARTMFHEMAHSCGYLDDPDCVNPGGDGCPVPEDPDDYSGACRVGFMMNEECCESSS